MDEAKYFVFADCCTSGNCIACQDLPVGSKVRRSIMGDKPMTMDNAKKVRDGWRSYSPTIQTADGTPAEKGAAK